MKKLALIGAARPRYEEKVKDVFNDPKCNKHCWTGWSYRINPSKLKLLSDQFNKDGYFNIYYHDIENPENPKKYGWGTGFIEYRLIVEKYMYDENPYKSPEPECTSSIDRGKPHRLYACVFNDPVKIPSQKWTTFSDIDTGKNLSGPFMWRFRNAEFGYIIDPEL